MNEKQDAVMPCLCYVSGCWAFFTTQTLDKQWGDDWNDAPYEHNAGTPYGPTILYKTTGPEKDPKDWNPDGTPKWEIIKVAWEGDFETPSDGHNNSPFSVEQINAGAIAWLRASRWRSDCKIIIPAGTPLDEFKTLIEAGGGHVYKRV